MKASSLRHHIPFWKVKQMFCPTCWACISLWVLVTACTGVGMTADGLGGGWTCNGWTCCNGWCWWLDVLRWMDVLQWMGIAWATHCNKKEMDVSRQALMQAVDRVSILSHEKSRSIKFGLHKDNLMISANNPDQENALEEVKVEYDNDDIDVGFNAKYLSEIGGHIEGEDMLFYFKDSTSPVIVKDPEDTSSLFVVMPMRI